MALSKRIRFDTFKRDDFTCQYCGRKTPLVVLEVDHIVPVVEGGGDEIENLTTSCFDCNRGKSGTPLTSKRANEDLATKRLLLIEREEQLREYNAELSARIARENADYDEAWNHWFELRGVSTLSKSRLPLPNVLRGIVRRHPVAQVKQAMRIAFERLGCSTETPRYFAGVCKGFLAEADGRVQKCPGCGGHLRLEIDEDKTAEWWHGDCLDRFEAKLKATPGDPPASAL